MTLSVRKQLICLLCLCGLLTSCSERLPEGDETFSLRPVSFAHLPGWSQEDGVGVSEAFHKTCSVFEKRPPHTALGYAGKVSDWRPVCQAFRAQKPHGANEMKRFFETYFHPYQVQAEGIETGLFTGYYEPELRGSFVKDDVHRHPLYKKPDDLILIEDLGVFRSHLKGERIAGRVMNGRLRPYADRAAIDKGALSGKAYEILWVDCPVDSFFLHIQGSGKVIMPSGDVVRVGYDGQNGHVYEAIGKYLVETGEIAKEDISMQSIKAWLRAHPNDAKQLMHKNRSYIFFRVLEVEGPVGSMGVALTPRRSLAVDKRHHALGIPMWVNASHPGGDGKIQQLVFAQDTGGAIRGPIRGDFFWGSGEAAERHAGLMKEEGALYVLLPKTVTVPAASL